MRTAIAVIAIVMGLAMLGIWSTLLARRQVPEIAEGKRSIWFHIAAESVTATLLIGAGAALLSTHASWASLLASAAFGLLLYSTINSAGYYADLRQIGPVVIFGVFSVLAVSSLGYLIF